MRLLTTRVKRRPDNRVVLLLQDNKACWFNVVDENVVDTFVELVSGVKSASERLPAWAQSSKAGETLSVQLILDTTLDEVDRISVASTGHWLIDWYRKQTTLARLRADYRQSSVYALPSGYQAAVAAVMHPAHPAVWAPWLLGLQSRDIVFNHVCTGTELVARWSRRFDRRVLVVMQTGSYQRHLLVDNGAAVFLRTLSVKADSNAQGILGHALARDAVQQSMQYIVDAIDLGGNDVLIVGLSGDSAPVSGDDLNADGWKAQLELANAPSALKKNAGSGSLVSMLLDVHVEFRCHVWSKGEVQVMTHGSQVPAELAKSQIVGSLNVVKRLQNLSRIFTNQHDRRRGWPLLMSATRCIDALAPSVQYQKASRQIAYLLKFSVALAVMATLAMSVAIAHGVTSARTLHQQKLLVDAVLDSASQVQLASSERYVTPRRSADSLFLMDQLAPVVATQPLALLDEIASAVTAIPSVSLDRLVWAIVENDEQYDALSHSLASVGHRQSLAGQAQTIAVQLELAGRVAGQNLAHRKTQLDQFVSTLDAMPLVLEVKVLESPADAALSSVADTDEHDSFRLLLIKSHS